MVAGRQIRNLYSRTQGNRKAPRQFAAGVPRRGSARVECLRCGSRAKEPLGRHHCRRQVVQAAQLGLRQGEEAAMKDRSHGQALFRIGAFVVVLAGASCEKAASPGGSADMPPTITTKG